MPCVDSGGQRYRARQSLLDERMRLEQLWTDLRDEQQRLGGVTDIEALRAHTARLKAYHQQLDVFRGALNAFQSTHGPL